MKIAPKVKELQDKYSKMYAPLKYFRGLPNLKAV